MGDSIFGAVFSAIMELKRLSDDVSRHKEQVKLLTERVKLLETPLLALKTKSGVALSLVAPLKSLDDTLRECLAFVQRIASPKKNFLVKIAIDMWDVGKNKDTISILSQKLDMKAQALQLALSSKLVIDKADEKAAVALDANSAAAMVTQLEKIVNNQCSINDSKPDVRALINQSMSDMKDKLETMGNEQIKLIASSVAQGIRTDIINALQRVQNLEELPQWMNSFSRSQNEMMAMCKGMEQQLKGLEQAEQDNKKEFAFLRSVVSSIASQQESLVALQSNVQSALVSLQSDQNQQFKESRLQMDQILSLAMQAQSESVQLNQEQKQKFEEAKTRAEISQQQIARVQASIAAVTETANSTSSSQKVMMELLLDVNKECVTANMDNKEELKKMRRAMESLASSTAADKSKLIKDMESNYSRLEEMMKAEFVAAREADKSVKQLAAAQQALIPAVQSLQEQVLESASRQKEEIASINQKISEMLLLQRAAVNSKYTRRSDLIKSMPSEAKETVELLEDFQQECSSNSAMAEVQLESLVTGMASLQVNQEVFARSQKDLMAVIESFESEWNKEVKESKIIMESLLALGQRIDGKLDEQGAKIDKLLVHMEQSVAAGNSGHSISSTVLEIPESDLKDKKKLASGAFGTVYIAQWRRRSVAVKVVDEQTLDADSMAEFVHEATILSNLKHDNIVSLYGICSKPPTLYMVMEHMNGSLSSLLEKQVLSAEVKVKLAFDIACGMLYLIQLPPPQGPIIHRDLKSLNILVDEHMRAKIADFGLSKRKSYQTKRSDMSVHGAGAVGTYGWLAPEINLAEDKPKYGQKTDVYAYGVILWELITQQKPYKGLEPMQILSRIHQKRGPEAAPGNTFGDFAKTVDPVLVTLAQKCMSYDALSRPTFEEITESLYDCINEYQSLRNGPSIGPTPHSPEASSGFRYLDLRGSQSSGSSGSFLAVAGPSASDPAAVGIRSSSSSSASSSFSLAMSSNSSSFIGADKIVRIDGFDALQILQSPKVKDMWSQSFGKTAKEVSINLFVDAVETALSLEESGDESVRKSIVEECDVKKDGMISVFALAQAERKRPELFGPLSPPPDAVPSPQASEEELSSPNQASQSDKSMFMALFSVVPEGDIDEPNVKSILAGMDACVEDGAMQQKLLSIIANLAKHSATNRAKLGANGAVKSIFKSMSSHGVNVDLQQSACFAVGQLCIQSDTNRRSVLENGGIELIISAMNAHADNLKLQKNAIFALGNLAVSVESRIRIVDADGADAILRAMQHPSMSACVEIVLYGCGALSNIVSEEKHCLEIFESDSNKCITTIIAILQPFFHPVPVLCHAAMLLFKMTLPASAFAIRFAVMKQNGIKAIFDLLQETSNKVLAEHLCGILANLAVDDAAHDAIISSENGLKQMVGVMKKYSKEAKLQMYLCGALLKMTDNKQHRSMMNIAGARSAVEDAVKSHNLTLAKKLLMRLSMDHHDKCTKSDPQNCLRLFSATALSACRE